MSISRRATALTVPFALSAALLLAGCASPGQPGASGAANSPETARAYADCLTGEGIEGVFVNDDGFVGVQFSGGGDAGDTIFVAGGDESTYSAAEQHCTSAVPEYHAEVFDTDPAQAAQLLAQGRAFAACARLNGLTDFADPEASTDAAPGGKLIVPEGTTETTFVAVVTACASTYAPTEPPATEGGAAAPDADPAPDADIAFTMTIPEFGGAYTKEWAPDVTAAFFAALQPAQGVAP